jgi:2-oxoglutarate ferredoxin oxidoreductase subunit alpha
MTAVPATAFESTAAASENTASETGTRRLLEGSEAIAEAMVAAGCRFFAGYPMTPFTEVLENMARLLPPVGGVSMNAESELEAIGMAWGAAATGTRSATGSTGQGLSLMEESLAEITLARIPLVVLNMARAQGDYFQVTKGIGHGDWQPLVLAPVDVPEAVRLVQWAFHLADLHRHPVLVIGDYYLAHTYQSVDVAPIDFGLVPATDWALDGSTGGTGGAKVLSPLGDTKRRDDVGYDLAEFYTRRADEQDAIMRAVEPIAETGMTDDADFVVVSFGTPAKFLRSVCRDLRAEGHRVGWVRPVTLVPFPAAAIAAASAGARAVLVYENNRGQMIDDVRLAVLGRCPVHFIGRLSLDESGFGIAPDFDVAILRRRVLDAIEAPQTERATGQATEGNAR